LHKNYLSLKKFELIIKEDITDRMNQNNEKNQKKQNQKKTKYFDENKMIHDFSPEKNIQVIKPIPVELSFKQSNDNFLLNKKRERSKGLFEYNNLYKNNGGNVFTSVFQSFNNYNDKKVENQLFPFINSNVINLNECIFNSINPKNKNKNKKLYKPRPNQIKINVIINNYITTDSSVLKEEKEYNKKNIFGIKKKDNKDNIKINENILINNYDITKTQSPTNTSDSNKNENNNKVSSIPNITSKKFEIIKADKLGDNDLNYGIIKKFARNKKRGRKPQKESKRQHNALDQDNIIRKIQVHFLTFIICFINDLVQVVLTNNKDLCFKNINYEFKKTVNHAYIENLKSKKIGDILKLRASPKNRKFDSNINEIIFNKICSINPFLKEFFELSYLDMFNNYYIKEEREMEVEGYHVKLSQRTKIFNDLIEKNQASSIKIREIAEQFFINKKKNVNPIFVIEKNSNNI
jgi:hypothetical protein